MISESHEPGEGTDILQNQKKAALHSNLYTHFVVSVRTAVSPHTAWLQLDQVKVGECGSYHRSFLRGGVETLRSERTEPLQLGEAGQCYDRNARIRHVQSSQRCQLEQVWNGLEGKEAGEDI